MTFWRETTLGQLLRIKHGFAFKGEFFADEGAYVLLTPGNFRAEGGIRLKGDKEKFYVGPVPEDYVLNAGDIVVAMTDLTQNAPILGSAAVAPESGRYLHNQRLGKVVDIDATRVTRGFVYCLFNSPGVRSSIRASATGATVRHTAPERIYSVPVRIPPLDVQRRIAGILSAYDDLIENCERRIRVLDEMARSLYREWFVDFRFPGQDRSARAAMPTTWRAVALREVADVNAAKVDTRNPPAAIGYIDIASVSPGKIEAVNQFAFDDAPGRARRVVRHGDTLWSCVRPNRRSHALVVHPEVNTIASTGFAVLTPRRVPASYLYLATTTDEFVGYLEKRATGAAYPAVTGKDFEETVVVLPAEGVVAKFGETADTWFAAAAGLAKRIKNLRATRDLLLPRLLSGQLSVDDVA